MLRCRMTVLPAALLLAVVAPARAQTHAHTETGRAGGAYLEDVDRDGNADGVPVRDPSVFAEGRDVRLGVSVAF